MTEHQTADPLTDSDDGLWFHPRPPWRAAGAVGWAVAGALAAGGAWWVGLLASRHLLGVTVLDADPDWSVLDAALFMAGVGAVCGGVVGGIAVLVFPSMPWIGAGRWLLGIAFGACGGALSPIAVAATGGVLPPALSSALVWALVGLLAGAVGYTWRRGGLGLSTGAGGRLLPVGIVSCACMVVAVVGSESPLGWAMLAVGLLGLGVVWALAGQERRLRELEKRFPKRSDDA
jgi:MFS family permease